MKSGNESSTAVDWPYHVGQLNACVRSLASLGCMEGMRDFALVPVREGERENDVPTFLESVLITKEEEVRKTSVCE